MRRWRPTRRRLNRVWRSLCHLFGTLKNISATPTSVPRHFFVNYQASKKWPSSQKATSKIVFRNGTCIKWLCMTADKATFTGGYYPSKISLKLTICLSGTQTKHGPAYPKAWKSGFRKDPRIQTMRRQAHVYTWTVVLRLVCLWIFRIQIFKTEARRFVFPIRVLRVHVCKSSKKGCASAQQLSGCKGTK